MMGLTSVCVTSASKTNHWKKPLQYSSNFVKTVNNFIFLFCRTVCYYLTSNKNFIFQACAVPAQLQAQMQVVGYMARYMEQNLLEVRDFSFGQNSLLLSWLMCWSFLYILLSQLRMWNL